jgi:competence protein ComEC
MSAAMIQGNGVLLMLACLFALAFGIVAATSLPELPSAGLLIAALPLLLPLLLAGHRWWRVCGCLLLGLAWGILRGHEMLARSLPDALEGRDLRVRVCIEGLPVLRHSARGDSWRLRVRILDPLPGASGPLAHWQGRRADISWYGEGEFRSGEAWSMVLRLRAPRGYVNPGGFDYQAWLLSQGIDATGYAVGKLPGNRLDPALCGIGVDRWRYRLRAKLQQLLADEEQAGKLIALTMGDGSGLTPEDWDTFARTGTTHLMVISGMHITLVAMLCWQLASLAAKAWPRALLLWPAANWGAAFAVPATLAYALLAGMGVSVQRALLMATVLCVFTLRERRIRPWLAYTWALALVLVAQPMAALQTGFWLSFITVAALLMAFGGRLQMSQGSLLVWRPQLVVFVALWAPLALAGQQQPWLAPLVNMIAIPLVDLLVVPTALLGCVLLAVGDAPAWIAFKVSLLGLEGLSQLLELAREFDPQLPAPAADNAGWRLAMAALGTLWLLAPRGFPARPVGVLLLLPLLFPRSVAPPALELLMLDVGQGTAVIVRSPGYTLVYDAGPRYSERFDAGSGIVAPALRHLGVRHIDTLMLSHSDSDHAGGAAALLQEFSAVEVLSGEPVASLASEPCRSPMQWQRDAVFFEVLHPEPGAVGSNNNLSCVLRISIGGTRILLTGDIEATVERRLQRDLQRVDILLVPHHGSRSSSTPGFVTALSPRYALVSAGYRNRFGHPHPDVVARYGDRGGEVLNTAHNGAVILRLDADGRIAAPIAWRDHRRRFWFRSGADSQ